MEQKTADSDAGKETWGQETYLGRRQLEHFRDRLLTERRRLLPQANDSWAGLITEQERRADMVDRIDEELAAANRFSNLARLQRRIAEIDSALQRIEEGTFGYCVETGEPIGLQRLEAQPTAALCVEAQEMLERRRRLHTV